MKFELNKEYTEGSQKQIKEKEPSLFHVLIHQDDFTTWEFVIEILEKFFFMDRVKASEVTMEAYIKGMAICGTFARDYAEAKAAQIIDYSRENEFPLMCTAEVAV